MNFVVLPSERKMSIDNALLALDSANWLGNEVEIFAWLGDIGSGFIEYNNVPRIVQKVDDLTPYQGLIDRWIEGASQLPQPLQLQQAKQIKMEFVDALYNNKIRQPYLHWDGWLYDRSDEALGYMTATVAAVGLPRRIDEAFRRFIGDTATPHTINQNVWIDQDNASNFNAYSVTTHNNWQGVNFHETGVIAPGVMSGAGGNPAHNHAFSAHSPVYGTSGYATPTVTTFQAMNHIYASSVAAGGTSLAQWQPLNWSTPRDIDADEFKNALQQIVIRRTALSETRVSKNRDIQLAPDIAAVITYPAATGWPY